MSTTEKSFSETGGTAETTESMKIVATNATTLMETSPANSAWAGAGNYASDRTGRTGVGSPKDHRTEGADNLCDFVGCQLGTSRGH